MSAPHVRRWEPAHRALGRSVVAVGVFDGVHVGHQALLTDTVAEARRQMLPAVAVTFDRDPDLVLTPDTAAPQLLTLAEKIEALGGTGIEEVLVIPFTHDLAAETPFRFVADVLAPAVDPSAVFVGRNFRFGSHAEGTVETLERLGADYGFRVLAHDLVSAGGQTVSSTRIRALVAGGDVAQAARLLGREHRLQGTVRQGRGDGRALGVPTANVEPLEHSAVPADGVYAGRVRIGGDEIWPAAIAVGRPPSFPDARNFVECHLIGFDGDLYGREVEVRFIERLREQRKFDSLEELSEAMRADVARASDLAC